jgi:hypothetical protein
MTDGVRLPYDCVHECPACGVNLVGDPVSVAPLISRPTNTHASRARVVGRNLNRYAGRIYICWACPDCGHQWEWERGR